MKDFQVARIQCRYNIRQATAFSRPIHTPQKGTVHAGQFANRTGKIMRWKLKAAIQNGIALLPTSFSYAAYYWIQRHVGSLRSVSPNGRLAAAVETWRQIEKLGLDPGGKVFFEVGTGRVPVVPLAYWLMGAKGTVTVDLNPYVREELVQECVQYISRNEEEIRRIFGSLLRQDRLDELRALASRPGLSIDAFLEQCSITYIAPGDAADTGLPAGSIDFHTSYNVFEHIPAGVLKRILQEGGRILRADGLFVHRVDYSDHFSHSDKTISAINFLQYSDAQWDRYAGNRYMYMNRLRHDDFVDLFESTGHHILASDPTVEGRLVDLLHNGALKLDSGFSGKSRQVLATTSSWIVSKING